MTQRMQCVFGAHLHFSPRIQDVFVCEKSHSHRPTQSRPQLEINALQSPNGCSRCLGVFVADLHLLARHLLVQRATGGDQGLGVHDILENFAAAEKNSTCPSISYRHMSNIRRLPACLLIPHAGAGLRRLQDKGGAVAHHFVLPLVGGVICVHAGVLVSSEHTGAQRGVAGEGCIQLSELEQHIQRRHGFLNRELLAGRTSGIADNSLHLLRVGLNVSLQGGDCFLQVAPVHSAVQNLFTPSVLHYNQL
jgi:hypothetical protein